jgi:hypothetical protein
MSRSACVVIALGVPSLVAAPALGDDAVPVRLDYAASAGCPTRADFVAAVDARTPLARFVGDGEPGRLVSVTTQTGDGTTRGTLRVEGTLPREVSAENCADVTTALALILAFAIDPRATATPEGAVSPVPVGPLATAVSPSPVPPPAPPPAPPLAPVAPVRLPSIPSPVQRAEPDWFWGAGADLNVSLPLAGSWTSLVGPSVSVEIGARVRSLFAPSLRATGALDLSPAVNPGVGAAHFRLYRARLEARPIRIEWRPVALVPYLGAEVGSLIGNGEAGGPITDASDATRTWFALAEGLAVELSLSRAFYLNVSGEIREPLRRYRFVFQTPDRDIVEVPVADLAWNVGAAVRFW